MTQGLRHDNLRVPSDKSIYHRAIMLGSIAKGCTSITTQDIGEDCKRTTRALQDMCIKMYMNGDEHFIEGGGLRGLTEPKNVLDMGNSGATTRLLLGILAGQSFYSALIGDSSLNARPMKRVVEPLQEMGAKIDGQQEGNKLPLAVRGGNLRGIDYVSPIASAQVKSCVLLAGLFAEGKTTVTEPRQSRDHTERMLQTFGVKIKQDGLTTSIEGGQTLNGTTIDVPGDISSAAFFMVAAAIIPNSEITLKDIGLNPTRTGIIDVMRAMGADMDITEESDGYEPRGDVTIRSSQLKGVEIGGDLIPRLIDELPIIAVLAAFAEGRTVIRDAAELKVKESNRIDSTVYFLQAFGASVTPTDDGMAIQGGPPTNSKVKNRCDIYSHVDHRIAMAGLVMALAANIRKGVIFDTNCVDTSFPRFVETMNKCGAGVEVEGGIWNVKPFKKRNVF